MPAHIDLPQTIVVPDFPDQPQQTEVIIPGYYYSNVKLNDSNYFDSTTGLWNLDQRGSYIGTEIGNAKPSITQQYIFYIVDASTKPVLIAKYFRPQDGYVYLLSTERSSINASNEVYIPAGRIAIYVNDADNMPVLNELNKGFGEVLSRNYFLKNLSNTAVNIAYFGFQEGSSTKPVWATNGSTITIDERSHKDIATMLKIAPNAGESQDDAISDWPTVISEGGVEMYATEPEKQKVNRFNDLKGAYTWIWYIQKEHWNNTAGELPDPLSSQGKPQGTDGQAKTYQIVSTDNKWVGPEITLTYKGQTDNGHEYIIENSERDISYAGTGWTDNSIASRYRLFYGSNSRIWRSESMGETVATLKQTNHEVRFHMCCDDFWRCKLNSGESKPLETVSNIFGDNWNNNCINWQTGESSILSLYTETPDCEKNDIQYQDHAVAFLAANDRYAYATNENNPAPVSPYQFRKPYFDICHPYTWKSKTLVELWWRHAIGVYIHSNANGRGPVAKYDNNLGWSISYSTGYYRNEGYGLFEFGFNSTTTHPEQRVSASNAPDLMPAWRLGNVSFRIMGPGQPLGQHGEEFSIYEIQGRIDIDVMNLYRSAVTTLQSGTEQDYCDIYQFGVGANKITDHKWVLPYIRINKLNAVIRDVKAITAEPVMWSVAYDGNSWKLARIKQTVDYYLTKRPGGTTPSIMDPNGEDPFVTVIPPDQIQDLR